MQVHWHRSLEEVPDDLPTVFIAHEFLDALPVHQFQKTERGWCERLVDVASDDSPLHFRLVLAPRPTPASKLLVDRRLAALPFDQSEALMHTLCCELLRGKMANGARVGVCTWGLPLGIVSGWRYFSWRMHVQPLLLYICSFLSCKICIPCQIIPPAQQTTCYSSPGSADGVHSLSTLCSHARKRHQSFYRLMLPGALVLSRIRCPYVTSGSQTSAHAAILLKCYSLRIYLPALLLILHVGGRQPSFCDTFPFGGVRMMYYFGFV